MICLVLFVALFLSGCSEDSHRRIVYQAQKLYHQAERLRSTLQIRGETDSPGDDQRLRQAYGKTSSFCFENFANIPANEFPQDHKDLQSVAFLAVNRLAQLYYAADDYDSVIVVCQKLLNLTRLDGMPLLSTRLSIARALQALGNLEGAMEIYYSLMDTFYPPVDNSGNIIIEVLNLPLEISRLFRFVDDDDRGAERSRAAIAYYKRLIDEWPDSDLEMAARENLAWIYFEEEDWDKAIENLQLLTGVVEDEIGLEASMMIAYITANGEKKYNRAIAIYDSLLAVAADTTIRPIIHLQRGITYFEKGDYEKCREIMEFLSDEHPGFFGSSPLPQKYIARSFEKLGDWRRAEGEYRWLTETRPTSEDAFDAFLTIAEHYRRIGDKSGADKWYRKAEEFYLKMASERPGTAIEATAYSYLAEIARRKRNWDQAIGHLARIHEIYPGSELGRKALLSAVSVYREKLDQPAKADSLINILKAELNPVTSGKRIDVYDR